MKDIIFSSKFFNIKDTLECGQVFRYIEYEKGYLIISKDKCCYAYNDGENVVIKSDDYDYFFNYFDLSTDYEKIVENACAFKDDFISACADLSKGVRILKQDLLETAFSFIISQNNNISRIKNTIEKLSLLLGEKRTFLNATYYTFPSAKSLANASDELLKSTGLGYRSQYLKEFACQVDGGLDISSFNSLSTSELLSALIKIKGIGKKVANCIALFGYGRTDSFPVDTWIEKVYKENLKGKNISRDCISNELIQKYGNLSGYIQQYLFYYKRSLEKGSNK